MQVVHVFQPPIFLPFQVIYDICYPYALVGPSFINTLIVYALFELLFMNTCYELHRSNTTKLRVGMLLGTDGCKSRTCRLPAANCSSGIRRSLGTDEWEGRRNLPSSGGRLHFWPFLIIGHRCLISK